jgi:hypothetical protein
MFSILLNIIVYSLYLRYFAFLNWCCSSQNILQPPYECEESEAMKLNLKDDFITVSLARNPGGCILEFLQDR